MRKHVVFYLVAPENYPRSQHNEAHQQKLRLPSLTSHLSSSTRTFGVSALLRSPSILVAWLSVKWSINQQLYSRARKKNCVIKPAFHGHFSNIDLILEVYFFLRFFLASADPDFLWLADHATGNRIGGSQFFILAITLYSNQSWREHFAKSKFYRLPRTRSDRRSRPYWR